MARRKIEDSQDNVPSNKNKRRKNNFKLGEIEDYCLLPHIIGYPSNSPLLAHYKTPVQIGHFSTDSENEFCDDDRQLKYLSLSESTYLGTDLNEGYNKYISVYNDEENSFYKLLRWIIHHKLEFKSLFPQEESSKESSSIAEASSKIDFICTRKVLEVIISTVYDKDNPKKTKRCSDWLIHATKFRSVIYLRRIQTEEEKKKEISMDEALQRKIYWGHKYEQCITSDSPGSKPNTSRPVNVNEEYFAVMEGKLYNHGILFSAEMDAVDPAYDSTSVKRFVEIKTHCILGNASREKYFNTMKRRTAFRSKLLSWFLQSFIAGVPRLICGFRDDEGIIKATEMYFVSDLRIIVEEMAKEERDSGLPRAKSWSPSVCLNFGTCFLDYVKQCAVKDDPNVTYKFYWKHGEKEVTCEVLETCEMPNWYQDKF